MSNVILKDEDYHWKLRDREWFSKVIGMKIEYASLSVIRQIALVALVPRDIIHGENDAEYHFKLGQEWQYYYRVSRLL